MALAYYSLMRSHLNESQPAQCHRLDRLRERRAGVDPRLLERFCIREGYVHRDHILYFDDTDYSDEYQWEVYKVARHLVHKYDFQTVADIGCGSGYKLLNFFSDRQTIGIDVEPTLTTLRRRYPDRVWLKSDFENPPIRQADIIICADVIEHLLNPDELLECLARIDSKFIVLSTPDRNLLTKGVHGPPYNPAHVREWNFEEFASYVGSHLEVVIHQVINEEQATQYMVCRS